MFAAISYQLQNAENEDDRIGAYGELKDYLEKNPTDPDAIALYEKYSRRFEKDWRKETVSPKP